MSRKWLWFGGTAAVLLIADLVTKAMVIAELPYRANVPVIDGFFNLVHARNKGAAFSFLAGGDPSVVVPFFLVVGVLALGFLVHMVRGLPASARLLPVLLGGIAGGAVGNMIDRVRFGYVVDFVLLYVGDFHWPAFNVADIGISVGVVVLIAESFWGRRDPTEPEPNAETR